MSLAIRELETPRLRLRGFREDDLGWYAALTADPEVMRHVAAVLDRPGAWRQIALFLGHWALRGYGQWALELRSTGEPVGRAGLWEPEGWPGLEVGWMLAREHWGHGYATEAAEAAKAFARSPVGAARLISVIRPANARSVAVAQRIGFAFERAEELGGHVVHLYGGPTA